jgi:predicted aspartyl protease
MGPMSGLRLVLAAALTCGLTSPGSGQAQLAQSPFNLQLQLDPAKRKPAPFELARDHILFEVQVEGRTVWAMLDNGAGRTVIDAGFAKSVGLKASAPVGQARTVTGALDSSLVSDVHIVIPGQVGIEATLGAIDLSFSSKMMGRPISLVVGKEVFQNLAVAVLSSRKTLEFWPSTADNLPPQVPRLKLSPSAGPIILDNDTPQIRGAIGGKPVVLAVDLGDPNMIAVSKAAWHRLGLDNSATIIGESAATDGRPIRTKTTMVSAVRIGWANGSNAAVTLLPVLPEHGDGRLGIGFFRHYDFAIDLRARRIWLLGDADIARPLQIPKEAAALKSDGQIAADAYHAVELYKSGRRIEAEKLLAALRPMARSDVAANSLCWAEATAGIALDSALQLCRDAVKQSNRNPNHVDSLGMALLQSNKLDEALAAYTEAIDKGQGASSYMGRAIIHARRGEAGLAQADLAEARRRDAGIEARFAGYGLKVEIAATP